MAPTPTPLVNPLVTINQLQTSASSLDGLSAVLEDSVRYEASRLVQGAGILLRVPQDVIAQAIVLLCRFWTGPDGASMLEHDAQDVAATALYLATKPSGHSLSPRLLLTVFEYLSVIGPAYDAALKDDARQISWSLSDGRYDTWRARLYAIEARMLGVIGFQIHVALPYTVCINYMQALQSFQTAQGTALAQRAFEQLNSALFSPQLLFLTHQPYALATAAIYLAAREVGLKLPEAEWWEVFDVDREDLGFLVVAFQSMPAFATEQASKTASSLSPSILTLAGLQIEMQKQDNK